MSDSATADIEIGHEGSAGLITLKRVKALNALTADMRRQIAEAMPEFARDPNIYAVVLRSESPRAFSSGSDVREVHALAARSMQSARETFAEEYAMNWLLECFSKPTISLINGMVMGGGVGISGFNTHKVAGENYSWGMPETLIGFFPDIGVAHALSRLGPMGQYLGLTGRSIGRADALKLGLATHCIDSRHFDEIVTSLAGAYPVDPHLDGLHTDPGEGALVPYEDIIASAFAAPAVEDIISRLDAVQGDRRSWAQEVIADLLERSPVSLKVTHRYLKEASELTIREALMADYRLACRFLEGHDFKEGVRAALIDKDRSPAWIPGRLDQVTSDSVDAYFAPLPKSEAFVLPTREEMQKARV